MDATRLNLATELCEDAERLAPLTRPASDSASDPTATTLEMKTMSLRSFIAKAKKMTKESAPAAALRDLYAAVDAIVDATGYWLNRSQPTGHAADLGARILENGRLLRTMRTAEEARSDRQVKGEASHRVATRPRIVVPTSDPGDTPKKRR